MPFLAPVFAAAGAAVSATFTAAGLAKMVINLLINVGLALLQMALTRQPTPQDVTNVVRQSTPVRTVHLGRVRAGGPMLFIETAERILYQVIYFSEGEADGFEEWFIDNRSVVFDADGWVTTRPYGSQGNQRVQILSRTGQDPSSVYEPLRAAFPGVVTNSWRGDGMVTAMISAKTVKAAFVAKHYPNRIPQLNVLGRFGKPYDPRTGTRRWTDSLPLLLLEYLTSPEGAAIPVSMIDLDDFAFAARYAADILPTKDGGTVRRYHGSLSWRLDEAPKDVISRALMTMDGALYLKPSGTIGFRIGRWEAPTVSIPDSAIIDAELRDAASPVSESNEIVVRYTNPNANFTAATSDPWRNREAYEKAGGRYRNMTVDCYGIQNHNHARRIAKILDAKLNAKWQGTIRTNLVGMQAWDQRFIRVTYADLGIVNETFEVLSVAFDEEDLTCSLQIASASAATYEFNPATEEGTAPVDPATLGDDAIPTPTGFKATFSAETVKGDRRISVLLSVDKPKRKGEDADDVTAEFAFSRADLNRWKVIAAGDEDFSVEQDGLVETRLYDFRVRFRTAQSEPGSWVVLENQKAIDPDPPGACTAVRTTVRNDGGVSTRFTAPTDPQTATVRVWRNVNSAFKGSTLLATLTVTPGQSTSYVDASPGRGRRWYFVRAANGSDINGPVTPSGNNPVRID